MMKFGQLANKISVVPMIHLMITPANSNGWQIKLFRSDPKELLGSRQPVAEQI